MNKTYILRQLNNINMEIGKLMAAQDDAIRNAYAQSKGFNGKDATNEYVKNARKFLRNYFDAENAGVRGGNKKEEDKEMIRMLAAGYGDEMISEMELAGTRTKDPRTQHEIKKAIADVKRVMAKREALLGQDKYSNEFKSSIRRNEGAESNSNGKQNLMIICVVCLGVALIAAIALGPSLVSSIKEAAVALTRGDLSIGEKLMSILKAAMSIIAIALPLGFGLYFLYQLINYDKANDQQKNMAITTEYIAGVGFKNAIDKLADELERE